MGSSKWREPSTNSCRVLLVLLTPTHRLVLGDLPLRGKEEGAEADVRHA